MFLSVQILVMAEEVDEKPFLAYVGEKFDAVFTDNLPVDSIKELPFNFKYIFGSCIFSMMISVFLYFTITSEKQIHCNLFPPE